MRPAFSLPFKGTKSFPAPVGMPAAKSASAWSKVSS